MSGHVSAQYRLRRHPAEVTADRLREHYEQWGHKLSGSERIALENAIQVLTEIAEGER